MNIPEKGRRSRGGSTEPLGGRNGAVHAQGCRLRGPAGRVPQRQRRLLLLLLLLLLLRCVFGRRALPRHRRAARGRHNARFQGEGHAGVPPKLRIVGEIGVHHAPLDGVQRAVHQKIDAKRIVVVVLIPRPISSFKDSIGRAKVRGEILDRKEGIFFFFFFFFLKKNSKSIQHKKQVKEKILMKKIVREAESQSVFRIIISFERSFFF